MTRNRLRPPRQTSSPTLSLSPAATRSFDLRLCQSQRRAQVQSRPPCQKCAPAIVDTKTIPASSTPADPAPGAAVGSPKTGSTPINLEPPSDPAAQPAASPQPPSAKELESVPLPPLGNQAEAARPAATPARDAVPAQAPSSTEPPATVPPLATGPDDLPPLPQNTGQETSGQKTVQTRDVSKASPAAEPAPPAVAVVPDDLPPLPPQGSEPRQPDSKIAADVLPPARGGFASAASAR